MILGRLGGGGGGESQAVKGGGCCSVNRGSARAWY